MSEWGSSTTSLQRSRQTPSAVLQPTLPGRDYHSADVLEVERERVFAHGWVCVGRDEDLPAPGHYLTREILGEPIFLIRGKDARVRAFANTCRHRGTRLLDGEGSVRSAIKCPYHAWTYGLDGSLLGSPNVGEADGLERERFGLWEIGLDRHDGFLFVNIDGEAPPLSRTLEAMPDSPLELARYGVGELRVGARRTYDVAANWKIVVENYHECLHCPGVHPELVKIVPLYRKGEVEEDGQSLGNTMGHGLTSFTSSGLSSLPPLPGLTDEDVTTFYGVYVFPNLILNYHSETVNAVYLYPEGPERTTVVSEFLFRLETIERDRFDPSEVVDFRDLVATQDWTVCELAQRGVRSRFYQHGVYPRQEKYLHSFNQRYLAARGPLGTA
ncbi:MAG TPA: aromatic ring-hydroxylating dioxygenase subunit alpha [Actinomycetota bacterium]|nr:aromatic ring-hydroxylating dioxygenase subunit alpha [Actinomycetota bacterium]